MESFLGETDQRPALAAAGKTWLCHTDARQLRDLPKKRFLIFAIYDRETVGDR
ncbi:MAG TPA: hypothetical protein VKD91_14225 [Pyrinomonadaceae bacterium]|nr:hypothetical protein [Pyrinomonadaceae bacterium]